MFQEALSLLVERLKRAKAQGILQSYALIGGFAVSAWGVPRATRDFDFVIALGSATPRALAEFLGGDYQHGTDDDPLRGVFHLTIKVKDNTLPAQLILLPHVFTGVIFRNVVFLEVFDRTVPVVSWKALVVLKVYAGGRRDLVDAHEIIATRNPSPEEILELASMADDVGILDEFTTFQKSC